MKKLLSYATVILLTTLVITVVPTEAEAQIYEDTIRLHILANSNDEADQALKLEIRDEILKKYGELLSSSESKEAARETVENELENITADCKTWIIERGFDYSVNAKISEEWYDTREYEDFTLPAGYYQSLQIIIGDGEGKNWWCVMYPPLCMEIATEDSPSDDAIIDYTKEELTLIKNGKYKAKFKILEVMSGVFAKNG